jgi:hypothetical protein
MNYSLHPRLNDRLQSHFAVLKTFPAIGRNWQIYAAVTGSAMAMATSLSAGNIVYAAGPVTASVKSAMPGSLTTNWQAVVLRNGTGAPIGKSFSIGVKQEFFDSIGGTASVAGKGGLKFLHVPFTGGNLLAALPVKELGFGALISSKAGAFGGSFGISGFVASERPAQSGHMTGWPASKQGVAGFSFTTGKGGTDYGWVRLDFTLGRNQVAQSITAVDWAYTNGPITTGNSGAPEPSTFAMALLAAGAAGVVRLSAAYRSRAAEPSRIS